MTPEQNSYLRQAQERRDARANMPGPSGTNGMSPASIQDHLSRMNSDVARSQMANQQSQAAHAKSLEFMGATNKAQQLSQQGAQTNQNLSQNANTASNTFNAVNKMQAQMDQRSQGGPSQAYLDRYNGGQPMNKESTGFAPPPKLMTRGGGMMGDPNYYSRGGGGTNKYGDPIGTGYLGGSPTFDESSGLRKPYKGADGTVTGGEPPRNNGGGISSVRDSLGSNQQRRYDKRAERHQQQQAMSEANFARDMDAMRAKGASNQELAQREMEHKMKSASNNKSFAEKMKGLYGGTGGQQQPAPGPSGGVTRPTPGFAPPKAIGGIGSKPVPRPSVPIPSGRDFKQTVTFGSDPSSQAYAKAYAQQFKDKRQERMTGKKSMPYG